MIDDAELLRRYVALRAEEAFAAFVARHLNLVYFAALRRVNGNAALAEDVAQQVFTTAAREAATLCRHATVTGWLYTTTRNLAAKAVRAEAVRQRHAQALAFHLMQTNASEPAVDWERLRPVIDESLEALNAREREAVLLRFFEERAFAEIGAALKISEDAARMRVERALGKLHVLLASRGVTSTAAALGVALTQQAALAAPPGVAASVTGAALAGAGGTGGTAVGFLSFMSAGKIMVGVAGVVLGLTVVGTVREVQAGHIATAGLAVAMRGREALLVAQERLRVREAAAAEPVPALPVPPAAVVSSSTPAAEEPVSEQVRAGWAYLDANPALKQTFTDYARGRIKGRYLALYRALRLSPAQIEQFENLTMPDDGVPKRVPFPVRQDLVFTVASESGTAERETKLRALLGDEGYGRWQEFNRQLDGQQVAAQLAGTLAFTATPLTPAQADRVAEIVASSRSDPAHAARTTYDWNAIGERARGILAAPQLAALRDFAAQDEFDRALGEAIARGTPPAKAK